MRTNMRVFFCATAASAILALCAVVVPAMAAPLAIGATAPDFNLKNVDGEQVALGRFADMKAVVVVFSCNHCPYAQAYQDRLIRLQNDFASKGVQFILINPNDPKKQPPDSFENMQKRAKEKKYPFPYLIDQTQAIAKAYGATRTPEVYLFDTSRKLVYQGRIDDNTEEKQVKKRDLKDALDLLLAGTPEKIETKQTKAFGCTIKWREGK